MKQSSKFLWGAATSAHQVEGNNVYNDWWQWEKNTPSIERSGKAVDHYHLFKEDFRLAKELGHTAHRLSIEWSRIEPSPGRWNRKEIEHYREVLQELKKHNISTFVTLHHFTNPMWLAEKGGWQKRDAVDHFTRYVKYVVSHLGDLGDFWITLNEPMVYAAQSYWHGKWPPQKRSFIAMSRAVKNLAIAHRQAYRAIHQLIPKAQVGIAKHCIAFTPADDTRMLDRLYATIQTWWFNQRFFLLTPKTHDFIGVNYYFGSKKRVSIFPPHITEQLWGSNDSKTDMGWPIFPEGLTRVLLDFKKYNRPIYITENGLADAVDAQRAQFLRSHLKAIEAAQVQGVDVRGYLHWSLLDNFEWADGFGPKFGLIEVDRTTMKRIPRPSAYVYKAIIESASQNISQS